MKNRFLSFTLACSFVLLFLTDPFTPQKIRVLVITGGHGFEHASFYDVFNAIQNISYDTLMQPQANALIASPEVNRFDVLVFYDMVDSLLPTQQQAYINLLNKGKSFYIIRWYHIKTGGSLLKSSEDNIIPDL